MDKQDELAGVIRKPVLGFEGSYDVSIDGRVFSLARRVAYKDGRSRMVEERQLNPTTNPAGYYCVKLFKSEGGFSKLVNRLVCEAFHGPAPTATHHAAHLDGNKINNNAANLTWATPQENNAHKFLHGTTGRGELAGRAKLTNETALKGCRDIARGESVISVSRRNNVSPSAFYSIIGGQGWLDIQDHPDVVAAREYRKLARAALSAALDIGGGRGS